MIYCFHLEMLWPRSWLRKVKLYILSDLLQHAICKGKCSFDYYCSEEGLLCEVAPLPGRSSTWSLWLSLWGCPWSTIVTNFSLFSFNVIIIVSWYVLDISDLYFTMHLSVYTMPQLYVGPCRKAISKERLNHGAILYRLYNQSLHQSFFSQSNLSILKEKPATYHLILEHVYKVMTLNASVVASIQDRMRCCFLLRLPSSYLQSLW